MKFSKFAFFAAGALLATSCATESNEPVSSETTNLESGFVQLELNLPTEVGTRAEDDSFVDGDKNEWTVKNGRVIIWKTATNEADATFVCMAELGGLSWAENGSKEITATSTATAQLTNIDMTSSTAQYCATVVLNYNGTFEWPTAAADNNTFGKWSQKAQKNSMTLEDGATYFTMSQAPKIVNAMPTHLVALDKSKIAQTEASVSGVAASFNVQRGVAKVVVKAGDFKVTGSNFGGDNVSINAWSLDVTNKSTYPVQVTEGLSTSYKDIWTVARFMGAVNAAFRRAFWSLDPNYDKTFDSLTAVEAEFNTVKSVTSAPAAMYCLENTFDINHQVQGQTTRVLLKGTYTPNSISGYKTGETFFRIGNSNQLWTNTTISEEIKNRAANILNVSVAVDITKFGTAGYHSLSEIVIKKNGSEDITTEERNKIAQALGLKDASDASIATYFHGECYYVARVKHFGDSETPWSVGQPTYNGDNAKWLGRYGIVRNTIYEVKVNSVSNPGSPVVPVINPTEPDDVNDYFIQATINILPWAKRVNDVNL